MVPRPQLGSKSHCARCCANIIRASPCRRDYNINRQDKGWEGKPEAPRGKVTCPRSHSRSMAEAGIKLGC